MVRNKDIQLKPEEAIRQLYLRVLTTRYQYPVSRLAVEYGVNFGRQVKQSDIVVFDRDRANVPYIIIELMLRTHRFVKIGKRLKDKGERVEGSIFMTAETLYWSLFCVTSVIEVKKPKLKDGKNQRLEVQQNFVNLVNQSYEEEDKSKQLLEIAKTGVEKAIEENEETATSWINQQLNLLGIELS